MATDEALIRMEDERDAALLEVEGLKQLLETEQKMVADLRNEIAAGEMVAQNLLAERDALIEQRDEAQLDAQGHRFMVDEQSALVIRLAERLLNALELLDEVLPLFSVRGRYTNCLQTGSVREDVVQRWHRRRQELAP
jgi:hypothetical protein